MPALAATRAPAPAEEFDHEIANIYSEEATELLEAAQGSLTVWNHDRKDKQPVAELQRQLHTLKGGARMAGVIAMGDLSHELETLVLQIDSGAVAGDEHAHAVMQASLDELSRMRDLVSAGTLPGEARDLIAQIRGLANQARRGNGRRGSGHRCASCSGGRGPSQRGRSACRGSDADRACAAAVRPIRRPQPAAAAPPHARPRRSLRWSRPRKTRMLRRAWN